MRKAVNRASPICVVTPSVRACRAAVSSTLIQAALARPARSTSRSSATKRSSGPVSSRTTWRLEISIPIPDSNAVSRSARHLPLGVRRQEETAQIRPEPADERW